MNNLYEKIINGEEKISLIGLGYVGMPLAVAFSRHAKVVGFDVNASKIELYRSGIDPTHEVGDEAVKNCTVEFTSDETKLREAKFHIIAVPTPINSDNNPNLHPIISASETLGRNLTKGSVVVYESTVYPGVTEETCVPILERISGLKCGEDFKVGYSPERINPGDKVHRLETIVKIVSGQDEETLETVAKVYETVIKAGVYRAESIKVAEAAKAIENSQRDINIAFMNELSMIFNRMGIDTKSVIDAASTKWNFLRFTPGLVGGHCIGVDPYYLTYRAEQLGYHSQIIAAGRRVNDDMGRYVAGNIIKLLVKNDISIKNARVGILGITFKEDCPDTRNTKVIDIINELREYSLTPIVYDPIADPAAVSHEYGIKLCTAADLISLDAVVIAVAHTELTVLTEASIASMLRPDSKILVDIKGIFDRKEYVGKGYSYWRL